MTRRRRNEAGDRVRIYRYIVDCGGATCDEVEEALGIKHQTASARINDLRALNRVRDSGGSRETRSGSSAIVWLPVPEDQHRTTPLPPPPARRTRYFAVGLTTDNEWLSLGPYYTPEARTTGLLGLTFAILLLIIQRPNAADERSSRGILTIEEIRGV